MPCGTTLDAGHGLRTAADTLKYLRTRLLPPYFTRESLADLLRTAEAFPAALSSSYMFERRLDTEASPIDFSLMFTRPRGGNYFHGRRDVLAGEVQGLPPAFSGHDAWRRIRDLARAWLDPSSPLRELLAVWLEHDVREGPVGVPIPLVFFTVEPGVSPAPALEILQDSPFASPRLATLRRCWDAAPPAARYRTVGIPYSRPTEATRLIFIMTPDDAFQYLERIGWPGSVEELGRRVGKFLGFHGEVALHVDVRPDGIEPQAGMEIYPDADALYRNNSGDCGPLLDAAVGESLCLPELRDALVAWPGSDTYALPDGRALRFDRMFHHLKVVSHPSLGLRAKAYTTAEYEVTR